MGIVALGIIVVAMVLYRVVWFSRREGGRRSRVLWFRPKHPK